MSLRCREEGRSLFWGALVYGFPVFVAGTELRRTGEATGPLPAASRRLAKPSFDLLYLAAHIGHIPLHIL